LKTILTIGHEHFLLPASANINAVLAILAKAQPLRREWKASGEVYYPEATPMRVSVEIVPDSHIIDTKKLKAIPEHASPDAHNTFGS
jgi:hypothetical protein